MSDRCTRYWQLSASLWKAAADKKDRSLKHAEREAASQKCDEIRERIAAHLEVCDSCKGWLFEMGGTTN